MDAGEIIPAIAFCIIIVGAYFSGYVRGKVAGLREAVQTLKSAVAGSGYVDREE